MKRLISLLIVVTVFASMFVAPSVYAAETTIYTQSFEGYSSYQMPDGWTKAYLTTAKVVSTAGSDGSYSFYLKDTTTKYASHNYSGNISVTTGKTYGLLVDVKMVTGSVNVMLRFFDSSGNKISSTVVEVSGDEGIWVEYVVSTKAPENAANVQVWLYTNSEQTGEAYFDNIRVIEDYTYVKAEQEITLEPPTQATPQNAEIVTPEGDKLVYNEYDENGNKLSDFSYAGYYAGKIGLPDSSKLTQFGSLSPVADSEDDTARIQEILDSANAEYEETGKMQVVTLEKGRYNVSSDGLKVKSGVVLAGEGQDENGTVIYAFSPVKHNVIEIEGSAPQKISEDAYVTDEYIPSGSNQITIEAERISDYEVGDLISICHPNDDTWNLAMGMKGTNMTYTFPEDYEDQSKVGITNNTSWDAGDINVRLERTITKIEGNKITVDFPFFVPYDTTYSKMYVYKTDDSGRYENVGIENLRIESYYNGNPDDENHAYAGVRFSYAKNCYVRDISTKYIWHSAVQCMNGAKQITIQNCSSLQPVSQIAGGRRYSFYTGPETQQNLIIGCYTYDGRHDYCTSYHSTGPTAFVDSVVDEANAQSETHGTWSTGVLYDNILNIGNKSKGYIAATNRGVYGTYLSQGWTGAGVVAWNCLAHTVVLHKPPLTYQNFSVGQWGFYDDSDALKRKNANIETVLKIYKTNDIAAGEADESVVATKDGTSFVGDAYKESEFAPVNPRSLYKAQLAERITGSYKNAKPNAPVITNPRSDNKEPKNTLIIKGMYQKGASKVTVYIDNTPYSATLNTTDYTFSLTVTLDNGTHKVFATQTIDGVESTKCADRFINVVEAGNHQDYLSSNYSKELTNTIVNDTRITYDEYEGVMEQFSIDEISDFEYGDSVTVNVTNNAGLKNLSYKVVDPTVAAVSESGVLTALKPGATVLTVSAEDDSGMVYSKSVNITVSKREVIVTAIDFVNNKVTASNVANGDNLTYNIKYKLKTKGSETSIVTTVKIDVTGDKKDYYFTNSTLDTTMPSEYIVVEGKGTEAEPYIIDTAYKFENIFASYADTALRTENYYFLQTADINIPAYTANTTDAFKGTYRGGKIENGSITYSNKKITFDTEGYEYASLFGKTGSATIEYIDLYGSVTNTAGSYTGGFAGYASATVMNYCNNNTVIKATSQYTGGIAGYITDKSSITNCKNNGAITNTAKNTGGITGYLTGSSVLSNCYNNGVITGRDSYAAGIVAQSYSKVLYCINNAAVNGKSVCGGVVGYHTSSGTIEHCANYGTVSGTSTVGGIAASSYKKIAYSANYGDITASSSVAGGITGNSGASNTITAVEECFNKGTVTADSSVGGIVGRIAHSDSTGCIITNCYNTGTVSATTSSTAGAAIGTDNGTLEVSVTGFYDTANELDIVGTVSDTVTPDVKNAYVISENTYTYAKSADAATIKALITSGVFSDSVWTNASLNPYPTLRNVPYSQDSSSFISGEYYFLGYALVDGNINLETLSYKNGNKPYGAYAIYTASFDTTLEDCTVAEYGVLIAKDNYVSSASELTMDKYMQRAVGETHLNGKYGILIYNSTKGLNGRYFVRPYVKYLKNGEEICILGEGKSFYAATGVGLNHWLYSTSLSIFNSSVTIHEYTSDN